jgi:hypothetical protein
MISHGQLTLVRGAILYIFSSFLKKSELISAVWLAGWLVGWLGALDLRTGKR